MQTSDSEEGFYILKQFLTGPTTLGEGTKSSLTFKTSKSDFLSAADNFNT